MALSELQLKREYDKWVKSLPAAEKAKVKEAGLDKPQADLDNSYKKGSSAGMQISGGSQTTDPDARALAIVARDLNEYEFVCGFTPLDEIIEAENKPCKDSAEFTASETARIKCDAVSALFGYLFSPINGNIPSVIEVTSKIWLLCYTIRPELIEGWSLERISKCYDYTKAAFSKRLIKMDADLNLHAKNRKSVAAVSRYRESTREWWAEKRAAEAKAKRQAYLAKWRKANAAEVKAYAGIYRAKNRERLNAAKRKVRAG